MIFESRASAYRWDGDDAEGINQVSPLRRKTINPATSLIKMDFFQVK